MTEEKNRDGFEEQEAVTEETAAEEPSAETEIPVEAVTEEPETDADDAASEEEEAEAAGEEKMKKSKKKGKPDKRDEQIKELNDRLLRNMAEFDNFRKRTDREKESMFTNGQSAMIVKILPVLDDLERGLGALTDEERSSSVGVVASWRSCSAVSCGIRQPLWLETVTPKPTRRAIAMPIWPAPATSITSLFMPLTPHTSSPTR